MTKDQKQQTQHTTKPTMPVYCITGTNRGLGLEFVRQLSARPSNTLIATVRSLATSDLTDLKAASHSNVHVLECDTSNASSVAHFAAQASTALNGAKIDFLLNSAGVNAHPEQHSLSLSEEALLENVRVNVLGPAKVVQCLLEADLLADNLRVLNMTSGLGSAAHTLGSMKAAKCTPYSISKAGLDMLTIHMGYDLRTGVEGVAGGRKLSKAVAIVMDPGWVKTRMGGEGSFVEPEESIRRMLECLHGLKDDDNQKFYEYQGSNLGW
jgi:NAD(P)-dependent dehydrogenase (short-subunit alcohol dehydrogenase family)